jgi:hypothetical protein
MSLKTINLAETVKKQFVFKLKANIDVFSSLVGIQLLAILFSLNGVGSMGMGGTNLSVDVKYYSADLVIVFTMLWSFVTAITITTKPYRNHDFTFVSNRLSSSLSNILFLLTASFVGSITANLSGNLVELLVSILFKQELFHFFNGSLEFVLGIGVTIIYVFFLSSIGYLIGTLVQVSKGFIILIPVLLLGSIFLAASMHKEPLLIQIFQFYVLESSLLLFILKTLLTTVLFFIAAISLLNRMEVRR